MGIFCCFFGHALAARWENGPWRFGTSRPRLLGVLFLYERPTPSPKGGGCRELAGTGPRPPVAILLSIVVSLPLFPYNWHLLLHILGAVLFLGNLTVTAAWMTWAVGQKDSRVAAFASAGVNRADRWFTSPGMILLLLNGLALTNLAWGGWLGFTMSPNRWIFVGLPLLVVHGILGHDHVDPLCPTVDLDHGHDLIRSHARDEIGDRPVHEARTRCDLDIGAARDGRERETCRLESFHLGRIGRRHRVFELATRAEFEPADFRHESLGAPPRFETCLRRPEVPDLVYGRRLEGALEGEFRSRRGRGCR